MQEDKKDDYMKKILLISILFIIILPNVFGKADVKLDFFGTEYQVGDPAIIWLQLLRNYQPINNATCYMTSYYPNKTVFLNRTVMTYLPSSDGLYYIDLTAPSTIGVYMLTVTCYQPIDAWSDGFDDYTKIESYSNITVSGGKAFLSGICGGTATNCSLITNSTICSSQQTCSWDEGLVSQHWTYLDTGNYTYNTSEIEVAELPDGRAKLKANVVSDMQPYGHWHLNEISGVTAYDSSGNGRNGTLSGGAWVSGKIANAWSNNYVDTDISMGNIGNFEKTDSFSVEAWIKTSETVTETIVGRMNSVGVGEGWGLTVASNKAQIRLRDTAGNSIYAISYININDDVWHHVVFTYNGSNSPNGLIVYIDGVENTTNRTGTSLPNTIKNSVKFTIGSRNQQYIWFHGRIDEVVVYNKTLTPVEIAQRYNSSYGSEETKEYAYLTTNPSIYPNITLYNYSTITNFSSEEIKPINTDIKYHISSNNGTNWYFWNGSNWAETNGSYAQANNKSEIQSHIGSFSAGIFKYRALLHTSDTNVTPELLSTTVNGSTGTSCSGDVIPCGSLNESACPIQNGCSWGAGSTGYIRSIPITLGAVSWEEFSAEYTLFSGSTITFSVLNSTNNIICNGLGGIQLCANATSPIKLYVNLTRTNTSSEIDSWGVSWLVDTIEEIRGAGEMHVSNTAQTIISNITSNITDVKNLIISHNATMYNETQTIQSLLTDFKSWMNTWFLQIDNDINSLQQKWIDFTNNLLTRLLGTSKSLQDVVGQTTGITPTPDCSLLNRILGTCL